MTNSNAKPRKRGKEGERLRERGEVSQQFWKKIAYSLDHIL